MADDNAPIHQILFESMVRAPFRDPATVAVAATYTMMVAVVVAAGGMMVAVVAASVAGFAAGLADLVDAFRIWTRIAQDGQLSEVYVLRASVHLRSQLFKLLVLAALAAVGVAVEQPRWGTLVALLVVGYVAAGDSLLDWTDRRRETDAILRRRTGRSEGGDRPDADDQSAE